MDWLAKTGQSLWQFLPLHQTELESGSDVHVPSPYKGYGIGLDPKYLSSSAAKLVPTSVQRKEFLELQHEWIGDYALFGALREYFHTDDWRTWDMSLRIRDPETLERWGRALEKEIDLQIVTQWRLHVEYLRLKAKASNLGIVLSGDLPFYLSVCSPLVWAHQDAFSLLASGEMEFVSGVTDISESFFGRQVWGHPLYAWDDRALWDTILTVWKMRLRYMSSLFESVRFDYAEALYHYGAMSVVCPQDDHNRIGPGAGIFELLVRYAQELGVSIFVEDSGLKTLAMENLLQTLVCPGIRIFCFGLDVHTGNTHESFANASAYPELTVACTSTHDTQTLLSYVSSLSLTQRQWIADINTVTNDAHDRGFAVQLRQAVLDSPAHTIIIPIQDWLLTTDRINVPGTETPVGDPNWRYQVGIPIEEFPI